MLCSSFYLNRRKPLQCNPKKVEIDINSKPYPIVIITPPGTKARMGRVDSNWTKSGGRLFSLGRGEGFGG